MKKVFMTFIYGNVETQNIFKSNENYLHEITLPVANL